MPVKKNKKYKKGYSNKRVAKNSNIPLGFKFLILFLTFTTLIGVGYIVYDLLKDKKYLSRKEIFKSYQTNYIESLGDLKDGVQTNLYLMSSNNDANSNVIKKDSVGKEIVFPSNTSEESKKIEESKKVKEISLKVFFFSVRNDSLVMKYKNISLNESDNVIYELFRKLKELRNKGEEISFINSKVELIDYKISGDTLILNLSKEIEYNEYGGQGILYSIYQIAFTLGNAVKVNKVLVLIDGNKPEYIGGEGIIFQNPIDLNKNPRFY
ncbi:MAG: GerMN domain-containing protein [Brevinematia bacterium]